MQRHLPTEAPEHERFVRHPIDVTVDEAEQLLEIADEGTSPATPAIILAGLLAVLTPLVALLYPAGLRGRAPLMTNGRPSRTERSVRRLFVDAVLAFSVDPGPDNLQRYLAASKALAGLRRPRQTPARDRATASIAKENAQ